MDYRDKSEREREGGKKRRKGTKEGRKTGGWEGTQSNLLHSWASCEYHLSSVEWSTSIIVYFLLK